MRQLKKAQDVISREKQGDLVGDTDDVIISRLRSELANAQQNLKKYADKLEKNSASLGDKSKMEEYEAEVTE